MNSDQLALAGLAHDLNNVLHTLGQASDLLSTDPNWTDLAATIANTVDRGRSIVASISEEPRDARLRDIASDASRGCPIPVAIEVTNGIVLRCKPAALQRALDNLFSNSVRAGAHRIDVAASLIDGAARIEIRDDGSGIPPEILPNVFQPGVSATSSTGLGLHIVQSIVIDHGGSVEAVNTDAGAQFTIRIPIVNR